MNSRRRHFLGTTAMYRVLTRAMFVAVAIPLLSIITIYAIEVFYDVAPTNKQIKDLAMVVWLGTLAGSVLITILRRRA